MRWLFFIFICIPCFPNDQDWDKLPQWAETVLEETDFSKAPIDQDVWRLLDETTLQLEGQVLTRTRRVVQYILTEQGGEWGSLYVLSSEEGDTQIRKLRGWHLNSTGILKKLSRKQIATVGTASTRLLTRETLTLAHLERVGQGSVVVFHSVEEDTTFFPATVVPVAHLFPTRKQIVRVVGKGKVAPQQFERWNLTARQTGEAWVIEDVPAFGSEYLEPDFPDPWPRIFISFENENSEQANLFKSWDHLARWYAGVYQKAIHSEQKPPARDPSPSQLQELVTTAQNITYRQRYLTPARGWVPARGAEVVRRAYGDCKDKVSFLGYRALAQGVTVLPALASIVDGYRVAPTYEPSPFYFNHVIAAIPLQQSLDLNAEVVVDGLRYLLVDPTSTHTRFGFLPADYRNRHIMICTSEGSHWVSIPDRALEQESVSIFLSGTLDADFKLTGSLEFREQGDGYGYRTRIKEYNPRDLVQACREDFDIPATAMLSLNGHELDEHGNIKLLFNIEWPGFLLRDGIGLRLPPGILGNRLASLMEVGEERDFPISFKEKPQLHWHLSLNTHKPLQPAETSLKYQDVYHGFARQAQTQGNKLDIHYTREWFDGWLDLDHLEDGIAYWNHYRKQFNGFLKNSSWLAPVP